MGKMVLQVTKLQGTAEFISLVPKGANRVPFRILKQEQSMPKNSGIKGLDLRALGSIFKSEKETPTITGIVVNTAGIDMEKLKSGIKEVGFSVDDQADVENGAVIFKQEGFDEKSGVVIKISDELALVTKGFSPYSMDVASGGASFSEVCAAQGWFPGINTTMSVLSDSIAALMWEASDPSDASAKVQKMMDEAKTYISTMINALPQKAFKMEKCVVKSEGTPQPEQVQTQEQGQSQESTPAPQAAAPEQVQQTTSATPAEPDQPDTLGMAALLTEAIEKATAPILNQIVKLEKSTQETFKAIKEETLELREQLNATQEDTDKAKSVMKSFVVGGMQAGDVTATAKKSEGLTYVAGYDSAFDPARRAKR